MHGAVLLDRDGEPIRPTILWNDGRAAAECDELQAAVPDLVRDRRHCRDAGLHRPKASLAEAARAGKLRAHRKGRSAEGLPSAPPDRRDRHRHVGRRGNTLARPGEARLVRRHACRNRPRSIEDAASRGGERAEWNTSSRCSWGIRTGSARTCRWRRRRRRGIAGSASARAKMATLSFRLAHPRNSSSPTIVIGRNPTRCFMPLRTRSPGAGSAWRRC